MTNEQQLIDQAIKGDSAAFGRLMRCYQDRLFTSIMHIVGQREEAEDIVQEAFLQALIKLSSFRRDSSFYTWLYRIALNLSANRGRRSRREVSMEQGSSGVSNDPAAPTDLPAQHMLRSERSEQIRCALRGLSEEFRTVLVLREIDGLDYQSIARVLEVNIGTVRSRLYRARSLMRDRLRQIQSETPPRGEEQS